MKKNFSKKIKKESLELNEILQRIRKRDFSGNKGIVIKNSIFQFFKQFISKAGGLLFTVLLARILMPELFGLYNLALSTILIFSTLSNLGIGQTLVRFISKELGNGNKEKAKAYMYYIGKVKLILAGIFIFILLLSAKFISQVYYQKPLFLALLAGALYIAFIGVMFFFQSILEASNYFKGIFHKEIVFQIIRILIVPLAALFVLNSFSNEQVLFYIILSLAFSYLLAGLFILVFSFKKTSLHKIKRSELSSEQTKEVKRFLLAVAAIPLSGIFFVHIDKIILGTFVAGEFIGYYSAALSLVGALASLMGFGVVLLPIFSRLSGQRLEQGLKKTLKVILFLSVSLTLISFLFAPIIILLIYGQEYNLSINILRMFSLYLFVHPLIIIYQTYFISVGKPKTIAKLLIFSTVLNIVLNYILITSLLRYGDLAALYGAGIATLISKFVYLGGLLLRKK